MAKRAVVLILDGFGIGEAPDSQIFGDNGANTCQHILEKNLGLDLPVLKNIGLLDPSPKNQLIEINPNKDTLSGISEMFGTIYPKFDTFEDSIPGDLILKIETSIGIKTLYGKRASGTQIMKELGNYHLQIGFPILYTSQDSVIQLLAHEEVITPSLLYYYCQVIRDLVNPDYRIGRIIARPFIGKSVDTFQRTSRRKDFIFKTENNPFLLSLHSRGIKISGNRIIEDIFGSHLVSYFTGLNNEELFQNLLSTFQEESDQTVFYVIDFEDFDMLYGHRRDVIGFGKALKKLDLFLKEFLLVLKKEDLLIITADHGNDPTFEKHTDHTREKVPFLVIKCKSNQDNFGILQGFNYISETIKKHFNV